MASGKDYDDYFAVIDNIRVSPPPADVVVRKTDCVFHPGHPFIGSNMTVRCYVDNVSTNFLADSRTVYVYYRWRYVDQIIKDWEHVQMNPMNGGDAFGNNQRFEAQIPVQSDVGDLEYYFQCDFDGYRYKSPDYATGGTYDYPSESLKARYCRGGTAATGGREFYARLRRDSSPYGVIYAVTEPNNELFEMTLVGPDEWRGLVPVGGQGLTSLTWHFRGENFYVPGEDSFATVAVHWAQALQTEPGSLPYGARCAVTNGAGRCKVSVDSTGYVMLTFNTRTLDYMACRAEYQNFNGWPAPPDFFSESNGQDPRLRLINTFDAWPTNVTERKSEYFVGYPAVTNVYWSDPQVTLGNWVAGRAAYTAERKEADINNSPVGLSGLQNIAMRLKGGDSDLGLGFIYNTVDTRPDGLQEMSFKCRLGQPHDPVNIVYNFSNFVRTNYLVRADVYLDSGAAPGTPSVSLIAYYTGPLNFYEYRITQIPDTSNLGTDKMQAHELYKWRNGFAERVAGVVKAGKVLSIPTTMEMRLYNTSSSSTTIKCKYGNEAGTTDSISHTDSSSPHKRGTYGFLSADGRAEFSSVRTQQTASDAAPIVNTEVTELVSGTPATTSLFDEQISFFAMSGNYAGDRNSNPWGIRSVVPSQNLGIYLHPSSRDSDDPPSAPGTLAWQLYTNIMVKSFGYSSYKITLHKWRADYVMLQVGAGGADVVVDELQVFSWRGQQSSDSGAANNQDWVADEAWVVASQQPGVGEGRLTGAFNTVADGPLDSVQLSARYADTSDEWVTNSTVLYKGLIYLSGTAQTNMFAEKFDGNVQLKIDNFEVLNDTAAASSQTGLIVRPYGWYSFELRLGRGASNAGGPYGGGINGYGVAYSSNNGVTWKQLKDPGNGSFLLANVNRVQLERSRSDPDEDQAVRSPVLNTGMGLMEFDYKVLRGPAILTVQYALKSSSGIWHDVKAFTNNAAMSGFEHASAYLGNSEAGYFRVLNDGSGVYSNSLVEIKNAAVWNEPFVADNSWKVYNAKITETDRQRIMLDETKGCFLNNSETDDASPIQDLYDPFVQSPRLYKGVGSLSFMARSYNGQPATVFVLASTNGWNVSEEEWQVVHRFNYISNVFYKAYEWEVPDGSQYDALRLATDIGAQRVCLEEIVVSEPVLPGFEITGVKTICKGIDNEYVTTRQQPMEAEGFGVEARIANLLLTPSNIQMYVSYYVGTNVWGVGNWPAGDVVTKPMYPVEPGSLTYRTSNIDDIPGQERDQVVQYRVWADYMGGVPLKQEQKTFDQPPWYYPLDLNVTYAAQGWSPYVIIYGLPMGAVWINEVNATDYIVEGGVQQFGIWDNQYVEIAVPAGFDLAGWSLDFVQNNRSVRTITLKAPLPLPVESTNGYAFFVIADSQATLPKVDYVVPSFNFNYLQNWNPGGIRLRRPMGMYEHAVAYEWDSSYGSYFDGALWAALDPQKKMVFVGRENNGGSLGVINNYGQVKDEWHFPGYWTPGAPNENQVVPPADALLPGFSNVLIIATMNSDKATQNGYRKTSLAFKMRQDDSTNITYAVDDWYRLKSLKVNGVEKLTTGEWPQSTYDLQLIDVKTNTTVYAQIGLRNDIAALGLWPEVLTWLLGFPDGNLVPSYYYGRELTLTELFWLNADPTVQHTLEGGIVRVERDPATNYVITARLALDGANCTMLQGNSVLKVEVKKGLTDPDWTMVAQYAFSSNSFDANHQSRIFTSNLWYEMRGVLATDLFFRWVIEMEDPRFIVWELINKPQGQ